MVKGSAFPGRGCPRTDPSTCGFGLSWLDELDHSHAQPVSAAHRLFQTSLQDQATPFSWDTLRLAGTTLQIGSVVEFGESGWFRRGIAILAGESKRFLSATAAADERGSPATGYWLGSTECRHPGDPRCSLAQEASRAWTSGDFRRTPWQGELSVGATQYWSRGNTEQWPLRELPVAEETSGRVPYVRYHQDL